MYRERESIPPLRRHCRHCLHAPKPLPPLYVRPATRAPPSDRACLVLGEQLWRRVTKRRVAPELFNADFGKNVTSFHPARRRRRPSARPPIAPPTTSGCEIFFPFFFFFPFFIIPYSPVQHSCSRRNNNNNNISFALSRLLPLPTLSARTVNSVYLLSKRVSPPRVFRFLPLFFNLPSTFVKLFNLRPGIHI